MPILSYQEYNDLWQNPVQNGFGQIVPPPSYHEYVQREIYQQDYLDLFLGNPVETFVRNLNIVPGSYLVLITGNPNLGILAIPNDPLYVLLVGNDMYLKVEYDFPWPNALGVQRNIRYIMIGEAPPMANSYFYNINQNESTSWLNAPVKAFSISFPNLPNPVPPGRNANKDSKLLYLAMHGYFLIDLFPFKTEINNRMRRWLNQSLVSDFFYTSYLIGFLNNLNNVISVNSRMAFSGPPEIHHYLAHKIGTNQLIYPPQPLNISAFPNGFVAIPPNPTTPNILPTDKLMPFPANVLLNGIYQLNPSIPFFKCCCYDSSFQGPNQLFIRNAFGI